MFCSRVSLISACFFNYRCNAGSSGGGKGVWNDGLINIALYQSVFDNPRKFGKTVYTVDEESVICMIYGNETARIPVILNIDVEPDEFLVDVTKPRPWSGFEFCHGYMNDYRNKLEEVTGCPVRFNWMLRMDPQIRIAYGNPAWAVDQYSNILDDLRSRGDAIGLHVHNYKWSQSLDGWIDDSADCDWVDECLETAVEAYRQSFSEKCQAMSFGNFFLSTRAVNRAESLGIRYDLTLEPGLLSKKHYGNRPQTAPTPSFCRVPRVPYQPSSADFRKPVEVGSRSITLIPLTSAFMKLGYGPRALRTRLGRLLRNGINGRLQSMPLAMVRSWEGENTFSAMLSRAIALQKRPYLAFTFRSNIHDRRFTRIDVSLKALLSHPASRGFQFCTASEAMQVCGLETHGT